MKSGGNISLDLDSIIKLTEWPRKHHLLLVIVSISAALVYVVFSVTNILKSTTDTAYEAEQQAKAITVTFDKDTIQSLKDLRDTQSNTDFSVGGRTRASPFVEK